MGCSRRKSEVARVNIIAIRCRVLLLNGVKGIPPASSTDRRFLWDKYTLSAETSFLLEFTPRSSGSTSTESAFATAPKEVRAAPLTAHSFQTGPNGVDEVVLGVAMKAPHRLVLVPSVPETH